MVLAFRCLKTEDEKTLRDLFWKTVSKGEQGFAYAVSDPKGNIIFAGSIGETESRNIGIARLRAAAAILFGNNTADIRTSVRFGCIDDMYSPGGTLIIANGAVCGSIGIAGRPKPDKMFPGEPLWDHEMSFQAAENLKDKLNLEISG